MNEEDAGFVARKVAEGMESLILDSAEVPATVEELDALRDLKKRLADAVFEQAIEFLPDAAIFAVANRVDSDPENRIPFVVAVSGRYVFVLYVGAEDGGKAEAWSRMAYVPSDRTVVKVETSYYERVSQRSSPARRATWTFDLPGMDLEFESTRNPDSDIDPRERVAQTIASLAGWIGLPLAKDE